MIVAEYIKKLDSNFDDITIETHDTFHRIYIKKFKDNTYGLITCDWLEESPRDYMFKTLAGLKRRLLKIIESEENRMNPYDKPLKAYEVIRT